MPSAFGYDPSTWFDFMHNVPPLNRAYDSRDLFMAALALLAVLSMYYPLAFAFRKKARSFLACLLYLAAFGSCIIMGFSPTIFASESRPFFLANIIMLLLCTMLIREGMTTGDPQVSANFLGKTKRSKLVIILILHIAGYSLILHKFVYASVYYWWY